MWLAPVIPGWWDGFQMSYRHGEAMYEIQVENPEHVERGIAWVEMDGRRIGDGVIPLGRDLVKHRIVVRMGNAHSSSEPHIDEQTIAGWKL
jgi:cyclic beta-1,2-glucan synthetase